MKNTLRIKRRNILNSKKNLLIKTTIIISIKTYLMKKNCPKKKNSRSKKERNKAKTISISKNFQKTKAKIYIQ